MARVLAFSMNLPKRLHLQVEFKGGYTASALGYGIHTQGEDWNDLKAMVRDAVLCHFDDTMLRPKLIRLHFVRDEIIVA